MLNYIKGIFAGDPKASQESHFAAWNNLANTVGTLIVIYQAFAKTLVPEVFLGYLAVVGGSTVASKIAAMRYSRIIDGGQ